MENNYTPIDINKLEKKDNGINTILLLIVTFTALVLAIMLFMLIQKKLFQNKDQIEQKPTVTPSVIPTTVIPEEELSPIETTLTPEASPTGSINLE